MADNAQATIPMFSPDGTLGDIPYERMHEALQAGAVMGVNVKAPDGSMGVVPANRTQEALKAGGKIVPYNVAGEKLGGLTAALGRLRPEAANDYTALPGAFEGKPENVGDYIPNTAGEVAGGVKDIATGKIAKGAHRVISGGTNALLPVAPFAIAAAPVAAGATIAGGYVGGKTLRAGAEAVGANPDQAQLAEDVGNIAGGYGAAKGLSKVASSLSPAAELLKPVKARDVLGDSMKPVNELTGTTPDRIAELQQFPDKVESIRQTAVSADKAARQSAGEAFPKFDKPIKVGEKTIESPILDESGKPVTRTEDVTTTFKDMQEHRSNLLQDISQEKRAVAAGNAPRFELARMYEKLHGLDENMNQAALDQGGPSGLAQLQRARQQFAQYMNDFHNQGSPLRKLVEAKPGETGKVVNHLLSADNGARTVETLGRYNVDVSPIQEMLSSGDRPVRVALTESAKLRKAGSPDAYTLQRLNESLSQAQYNELPSGAQARLPQGAMRNQAPGFLKQVPLADRITPRRVTAVRIKKALREAK